MDQERADSNTDSLSFREDRGKSFCETLSLSKSSIRAGSNSSVRSSCGDDDNASDSNEENCDKEFDRLSRSLRDIRDDSDDYEAKVKFFF